MTTALYYSGIGCVEIACSEVVQGREGHEGGVSVGEEVGDDDIGVVGKRGGGTADGVE